MSFTQEEWADHCREEFAKRKQRHRGELERKLQAGAAYSQLQGHPTWQHFVGVLEQARGDAQGRLDDAQRILLGDEVDTNRLMEAKMAAARETARIEAYSEAIDLPVQILSEAESAKESLG